MYFNPDTIPNAHLLVPYETGPGKNDSADDICMYICIYTHNNICVHICTHTYYVSISHSLIVDLFTYSATHYLQFFNDVFTRSLVYTYQAGICSS